LGICLNVASQHLQTRRKHLEKIEYKRADCSNKQRQMISYWCIEIKKSTLSESKLHNKYENAKRSEQIKKRTDRKIYWKYTILWILSLESLVEN